MSKNSIIYNKADIEESFPSEHIRRGQRYFYEGRVHEYELIPSLKHNHHQFIRGQVLGSGDEIYTVRVEVSLESESEFEEFEAPWIYIDSECTCPVEFDCKHAVALLLKVMSIYEYRPPHVATSPPSTYEYLRSHAQTSHKKETTTTDSFTQWTRALASQQKALEVQRRTDDVVLYLMDVMSYRTHSEVRMTPVLSRVLKKGGYGKAKRYSKSSTVSQRATTQDDQRFMALLASLQAHDHLYRDYMAFSLKDVDTLLPDLLKTQRVFWKKISTTPLSVGNEETLNLQWKINTDARQALTYHIASMPDNTAIQLLPVSPLWYYNPVNNQCGRLKSNCPAYALLPLLRLPPVEPDAVKTVQQQLSQLLPHAKSLPMPTTITKTTTPATITPRASLQLYGQEASIEKYSYYASSPSETTLALARLQFHYAGRTVGLDEPDDIVYSYQNGQWVTVKRDAVWEQTCVDKLATTDIRPFALNTQHLVNDDVRFSFLLGEYTGNDEPILATLSEINRLATEQNWGVHVDESFPVHMISDIDAWYSDLDEGGSGIDWFSLTLGVVVQGEKVNVLPLLVDLIRHRFRQLDSKAIMALPDDTPCPLRLENGHYISVPFPRVRNILLVLCELFDEKPLDEMGALRLSHLQAGLLVEIEKAMGATQLRWFGGERLRQFAKKLTNFNGIKPIPPAKNFTATLRPYQQQGLNWMQFLREYELGGILADDMGLGKTVQTLAHLSVEKSKKRLQKPSLLVVPTSLVNNWAMEAKRFSPTLSLLILHGPHRKTYFSEIEKAHIIITTYPLVIRDKDTLLAHEYYYLILDEAQQIKNSKAKVTQMLLQMKAQHRLCLTGTPMENHLGELWSIFNFILPGLLGNAKHFKSVFRTPIEQHGDIDRHRQLSARIKPFMLRRHKNDVVKELPKKTEIVRPIEIEGAQRDLYESIRLAMERRVREAVHQKGLNRSQIVILDALLKLRQICCAPSLLKLKTVKKNIASAKLDDLMTFLPDLIEEGRRILLFSSFTSMLALIEAQLNKNTIPYVKLTGQTRDRQTPIEDFQTGKVPLFIISLKAGGVGLNLTTADTVIHYDPWWNPAAEQQATDRAHRIGQKNPVFVYKLITKGTIEEKILEMQDKKRQLISGIVDQNKHVKVQLTQEDLKALFQPIESSASVI